MLAKVHLMSFTLSQVLVLIIIIMRSHSTGKQNYKRKQRASDAMQCLLEVQIESMRIITNCLDSFKPRQSNTT